MIDKNIIPVHWELKKLDEVSEIILGQSPPSNTYNLIGDGIPFFQGKADFTELYPVVRKYCNAPKKIAEPNDILLSVRAPVGTTNIADQKCCIGRGLAAIRFKNFKFLFYFLRSIEYQLDEKGTGTTFRAISGDTIRNVSIPLPPSNEQQQIVAKIEELFSELDNGKLQLETIRLQLKSYRQAVLKWAFEGRFTNKEFKIGQLPEGWRWVELDDICESKRKCSYGVLVPGDHEEDGIRLLRVGDINDTGQIDQINLKKISPLIANKYKRTFLEGGEVVISLVGAIGRTAVVPDSLKGANIARAVGVIPISKDISSKFVELMLRSPLKIKEHNEKSHEVARKTLNLEDVKNSKIPLPPREVQEQIVQEIETRLLVCDKMEETIESCLQQSESLRQSILKKAFEGKLIKSDENFG